MNYAALWELAKQQATGRACLMWPPEQVKERDKAERELALRYYQQMTRAPAARGENSWR